MEYVEIEVKAKTVDLAVEAAMSELGVEDREQVSVEVVTQPERGFLGMGGQDAVVRVKRRSPSRKRGRGQKKGGRSRQPANNNQKNRTQDRPKPAKNGEKRPDKKSARTDAGEKTTRSESRVSDDRPSMDLDQQADVAREFLEGLIDAYGLEGEVESTVDEDVIVVDVQGDQTEALVGVRGTVRSAIHELTRTVLQRYSKDTARLRLDIAGYAERRRTALAIYAEQLIEQLMSEGGEIMLEPMSPADRKVIHDAAGAHDGVVSYSEGEAPRRYVVLSRVEDGSEEE